MTRRRLRRRSRPNPKPEHHPRPKPRAKPKPNPDTTPGHEPEPKPKPKPTPKRRPNPNPQPNPNPNEALKADGIPDKIIGEIPASGLIFKDIVKVSRFSDPKVPGVEPNLTPYPGPLSPAPAPPL